MIKLILTTYYKMRGWQVVGTLPPNVRKAIFAVAPHTKNLDFFLGLWSRAVLNLPIGFLGKAELFKFPYGWIFRGLGGTPVIRTKNNNQVENVAETFRRHNDLLIALAPEGTRKNVTKLRTGFYYMALSAGVPIVMVGFDYVTKQVIFAQPFMPSGDFKKDMESYFLPFFKTIHGVNKDWFANYEQGYFDK